MPLLRGELVLSSATDMHPLGLLDAAQVGLPWVIHFLVHQVVCWLLWAFAQDACLQL